MIATPSTSEKYCVFRSGPTWFALPALSVREVTSRSRVVTLPASRPGTLGLCHVRNEFLPVLSLYALLSDDAAGRMPETHMLILMGPEGPWAVLVDAVETLVSLDVTVATEAAPEDLGSGAVHGWAGYGEQSVQVLDASRLYDLAVKLVGSLFRDGGER